MAPFLRLSLLARSENQVQDTGYHEQADEENDPHDPKYDFHIRFSIVRELEATSASITLLAILHNCRDSKRVIAG